jgi:hypothetical protein
MRLWLYLILAAAAMNQPPVVAASSSAKSAVNKENKSLPVQNRCHQKPKKPLLNKKKKRGAQANCYTAANALPPLPQPPKKRVASNDISALFDEPQAADILREVEISAIHYKKHGEARDYTPPDELKKYYATGDEGMSFEYATKDFRVSIYYLCCHCLYINLAMC